VPEHPPETPISPWWRHAAILVMAFGFTVLIIVTVLTYTNAPPVPARVTDEAGATLFTRENVEHGQEVFFKYGLMEHGTLWGHGAYLGPDYTAQYLHRLAEIARDLHAQEGYPDRAPHRSRGSSFDHCRRERASVSSMWARTAGSSL
jgi:nitric oxide reductase subunit B